MKPHLTSRRLAFLPAGMLAWSVLSSCGGTASTQPVVEPAPLVELPPTAFDALAGAVRFPTVSYDEPERVDREAFYALHQYLATTFPLTHQHLNREVVDLSLLYAWKGTDPDLPAILLAAHIDVVPANEEGWSHPPFAGAQDDEYLWGRGAMDDKGSAVAILQAIEMLVNRGFTPRRTLLIAIGHDEEVGGGRGAKQISKLLQQRGVRLAAVLDEGGVVVTGGLPGQTEPVALVGIAEKGEVNLVLTARATDGFRHSAAPPKETPPAIVSRAVVALQDSPFPSRFTPATDPLLDYFAELRGGFGGFALRHRWLFGPLVRSALSDNPATNAMIRSTIAPTRLRGSDKVNAIPETATAHVNIRLLAGDTVQSAVAAAREAIDDSRIEIDTLENSRDPSPVSPTTAPEYLALKEVIAAFEPGVPIVPYLITGGTDARYYAPLTPNLHHFVTAHVTMEDLKRGHGVDERIAKHNLRRCVSFYIAYIHRMDSSTTAPAR